MPSIKAYSGYHVANRVSLIIAGMDFSLEIKQCIVTRPGSRLQSLDPNCLPCTTEAISLLLCWTCSLSLFTQVQASLLSQ